MKWLCCRSYFGVCLICMFNYVSRCHSECVCSVCICGVSRCDCEHTGACVCVCGVSTRAAWVSTGRTLFSESAEAILPRLRLSLPCIPPSSHSLSCLWQLLLWLMVCVQPALQPSFHLTPAVATTTLLAVTRADRGWMASLVCKEPWVLRGLAPWPACLQTQPYFEKNSNPLSVQKPLV